MDSSERLRLVVIGLYNPLTNDDGDDDLYRLLAHEAVLEPPSSLERITFTNESELNPNRHPPITSRESSRLLYDSNNSELLCAFRGSEPENEATHSFNVWHIAPYLRLSSIEDTGLLRSGLWGPSLSFVGNKFLAATVISKGGNNGSAVGPLIGYKIQDSEWAKAALQTASDVPHKTEDYQDLVSHSLEEIKYTHILSSNFQKRPARNSEGIHGRQFNLFSIRTKELQHLGSKLPRLWSAWTVHTYLPQPSSFSDQAWATIIVRNPAQTKLNLYIFSTERDQNRYGAVYYTHVSLRPDGSVNYGGDEISCGARTEIPFPDNEDLAQPIALEWERHVLILVMNKKRTKCHACIGKIDDDDATLPAAAYWRYVKVDFPSSKYRWNDSDWSITGAALVDNNFSL